ncbi:hypothetical protein OSH11_23070 [Kaistia dalseonensis]|uniref:Uncharacterized protein n=1 Tax=Kaistia dalseonensis TaxID=410840 RepID=A0ABU0HD45_9HYPH|nr:hypothetical protein [Kaistia dalseonensis]MCX5497598.1 hypothetical protein [Kaistia dalseonensis]MDQ0440240.1 hypothetical protein [Kaistia dalseonensis]
MSKHQAALALAAALAVSAVLPVPAQAQFFGMYGGDNLSRGDCKALSKTIGPKKIWYSQFSGYKPDPWDRGLWHAWGIGCFKTYKECKSWLYNSQSDWPRLMDFTFCKQGLPSKS